MDVLVSNAQADWTSVTTLRKLEPPLTSALQAYQDRALASEQSFEHVVRLQAAVQG